MEIESVSFLDHDSKPYCKYVLRKTLDWVPRVRYTKKKRRPGFHDGWGTLSGLLLVSQYYVFRVPTLVVVDFVKMTTRQNILVLPSRCYVSEWTQRVVTYEP